MYSGNSRDRFEDWVQRARSVPIERELERRGFNGLRRQGAELVGACPTCGGEDRFAINPAKAIWHCRGCAVGGDVIRLVEHLDGVEFTAAVATLTGEPAPKANGKDHTRDARKIIAAEFPYQDESGGVVYVVERVEYQNLDGGFVLKDGKRKKTFRQRRPDPEHPGAWLWNMDGVVRLPYRLPELIASIALHHVVFVVEGEGKVEALREIGVTATCCAGGAGKWQADFSERLRGADVVLIPDNDDAGWKHANEIGASLVGVAGRIRVLVLPGLPAKGDVVDWIKAGGTRDQFDALVACAFDWQPPPETDQASDANKAKAEAEEQKLIDELARLNKLGYEKRRKAEAKRMGIRSSALDDAVEARRARRGEEEPPAPLFEHWVVEPWPEPVKTAELIAAIVARIKRHVVISDDQALTVGLWVLFAWSHHVAVHSPILLLTSAEANSGKTQAINVIQFMTPCALTTVGISEAVLFRTIDRWRPTFLVDEADTIMIDNEPLRAVINSGWTRGTSVLRCVGDDFEPRSFSTFCPKVVGMKGRRIPDTTFSRSIVIEMKRKKANESITHFRNIDDAGLQELRRRASRWAQDNAEKLEDVEPDLPAGFDNRLGDNWQMMLAIADHAGGEWPAKARRAAAQVSKVGADTTSIGVQLLTDIRTAFEGLERISSAELATVLGAVADGPWSEWKSGKPITPAQLARALKPFGIAPEVMRVPSGGTPRGYLRSQFEDAWERYLSAE
jgi:hypothetical protein